MIAIISKSICIIAKRLIKIMRFMVRKIVLFIVIFFVASKMICPEAYPFAVIMVTTPMHKLELLYENVWGTVYNPVVEQCDSTPTITGDGSKINPHRASKYRWVAISQEMINSTYRANQLLFPTRDNRFKGKIQYGDTIWVESRNKKINGWWVVKDAKNAIYRNSIDFLQTKGDGSLYDNNPYWNGKFNGIKIYRLLNKRYVKI
jgi:hypothetical protein